MFLFICLIDLNVYYICLRYWHEMHILLIMTVFRISACPLFEAQFFDIVVSHFRLFVDYPLEQLTFFYLFMYFFAFFTVLFLAAAVSWSRST